MNSGEQRYRWRIVWGLLLLCAFAVKGPHRGVQVLADSAVGADTAATFFDFEAYLEIMWDALVPNDFTPYQIMAKYEGKLAQVEDGSEEADSLYAQMLAEYNSAPVNDELNGVLIRLPGFIAPLEFSDETITDFLLVPYFGACIHAPPPPANQTVLVNAAEGQGINVDEAYDPVWIMGELTTERMATELAEAGYYMADALIEPYAEEP